MTARVEPFDERTADGKLLQVVVVDEHDMLRSDLRVLLDANPDISVVAEASNAHDGLAAVARTRADVAIIDVSLPRRAGVDLCRAIRTREPHTQVLMLTSFDDGEALGEALLAGAAGYVVKHVKGLDLAAHVRRVARGRVPGDGTSGDAVGWFASRDRPDPAVD